MARKNYTDEFRQRAVDLYESTPGATLNGIAADLGISRGALREWVEKHGSGTTTAGTMSPPTSGRSESQAARIVRLEAELAAQKRMTMGALALAVVAALLALWAGLR